MKVAIVATLAALPVAIGFAYLLARTRFPGKTLLDAVLHLPLVLPPVVTGYVLCFFLDAKGLRALGFSSTAFLDDCFQLQTLALRAMPIPAADPAADLAASQLRPPTRKVQAGEVRAGPLSLRTLDFADYQPPPDQAPACRLGDWLSIRLADDTTGLGQVCHISQESQPTLLLNPDQVLAVAMHPAILDRQLRSGDAVIRSGQSLFENAAGRAISQTGRN